MWWCPNLSVPDPTLILPLAVGLSFAGAIFISNNKLKQQEQSWRWVQSWSLRLFDKE